ncbi:pro-neuregulin-3, membrane-bound isoform [Erpetoichthys calabaricus]|uniref:pro-neuregulin-3, membrane-bound isoform n=1 Tax=Erpetoichthys calabaricus TaxID=27687 RepID=UPI002234664A|nr:pro-neuregulin-3, membrane-bound isoform [Erpetoichthys calabaricus]
MSEGSAAAVSGAVIAEDPAASGGAGGGLEQPSPPDPGPLRCGSCALWPRQQTWLCVVPLLIGFIGLGLSLMLLKWIVVGSVKDYVPTDLVDNKGIGQDPIFLSKPSAFPKNVETTTTTTTAMGRTRTGLVTTTTAANPGVMVPAGSGSSTSRAPNRISTRITTTTRAPRLIPPGGRGVTPRGTTIRRGTTGSSGVGMGTVTMVPSMVVSITTEAHLDATSPPSPSGRFYLHDSTSVWTVSQFPAESSPLVPTQPHTHTKTHSPTYPPEHSEHFKPCRDKDLAYCLNDGDCFVIETLTGSHKHCRCKDGYQGVRCDQFLPKTDSILSDPTDHHGIEFMESEEVYQRQVLSITCITIGITILGSLCVAFYCRNKRRREKLEAQLKESRSIKNYSLNTASVRPQCALHLQIYCKSPGSAPAPGSGVQELRFSQSSRAPSTHVRIPVSGKSPRSSSASCSPDERSRAPHRTAPRRTPPLPRGRLNPIGGSRDSGPSYQHLQEVDSTEKEALALRRLCSANAGTTDLSASLLPPHSQDSLLNMQANLSIPFASENGGHKTELKCSRLNHVAVGQANEGPPCSFIRTTYPTGLLNTYNSIYIKGGRSSSSDCLPQVENSTSAVSGLGQQEEVALLLETAQEQLRLLAQAQRKSEDCIPPPSAERESTCFLLPPGGGVGGVLARSSPAKTQLTHPIDPHRDLAQCSQ